MGDNTGLIGPFGFELGDGQLIELPGFATSFPGHHLGEIVPDFGEDLVAAGGLKNRHGALVAGLGFGQPALTPVGDSEGVPCLGDQGVVWAEEPLAHGPSLFHQSDGLGQPALPPKVEAEGHARAGKAGGVSVRIDAFEFAAGECFPAPVVGGFIGEDCHAVDGCEGSGVAFAIQLDAQVERRPVVRQ
jgi:hypothetical protein